MNKKHTEKSDKVCGSTELTGYLQCPCHDCGVVDEILSGADSWDCVCDNGPIFECANCPRNNKCPAQKDLNECPQCNSGTGVKYPRTEGPYCEDCGWPYECR